MAKKQYVWLVCNECGNKKGGRATAYQQHEQGYLDTHCNKCHKSTRHDIHSRRHEAAQRSKTLISALAIVMLTVLILPSITFATGPQLAIIVDDQVFYDQQEMLVDPLDKYDIKVTIGDLPIFVVFEPGLFEEDIDDYATTVYERSKSKRLKNGGVLLVFSDHDVVGVQGNKVTVQVRQQVNKKALDHLLVDIYVLAVWDVIDVLKIMLFEE
ncbi:TPM domain-containing protein [Candidatus Woesearchaeota archaeon]|nr:TPM domain-containing protein [Candidatus Woesearchaeota archaeon]